MTTAEAVQTVGFTLTEPVLRPPLIPIKLEEDDRLVLHDVVFPLHQDEFEQGEINAGIDYPHFANWM